MPGAPLVYGGKPGPYMPPAESTEWATPWRVFKPINDEFHFTVDVAALDHNTKVPELYFTPREDGLAQTWTGTAWCNPPYGAANIDAWLAKAARERERGVTTVLLLPNTTDCKWFHRYVWDVSKNAARPGIELRFISGRISFDAPAGMKANANVKGSILVIVHKITTIIPMRCSHCGK